MARIPPRYDSSLSRRRVLRVGGGSLLLASAAGCDLFSTEPSSTGKESGGGSGNSKEAPMLAQRVQDGSLPPLGKRLPDKPLVIKPTDRIGEYGGTMHSAVRVGVGEGAQLLPLVSYDYLMRWKEEWTGAAGTDELTPNVAERYEHSADGKEITFHLRPGMKWSDGKPFTADDIVFAVNDVLLNKELFPVAPSFLTVNEEPARIEKGDDYTFTLVFPAPRGLFLKKLAIPDTTHLTVFPRHYLEQFHKKYNPDVGDLVGKEGAADWVQLFGTKCGPGHSYGQNTDLPTLNAWSLKQAFAEGDRQLVLERNPYYWKVDPEGHQLPYIDELVFARASNLDVLLLKAVHGEVDVELGPDTRFTSLENKPVLARNRKKSGYHFINLQPTRNNVMAIYLNLTVEDPVKREIFRNRDFRIGLSYALNRQEMLDTAMQGLGAPYQIAPLPESPFYDEEMATQYLEHDAALANSYLDKAFPDRADDGRRIGPDGNPIQFKIEYPGQFRPEWTPMVTLVERYWKKVGVHPNVRNISRNLQGSKMDANKHEATVFQVDQGLSILVRPDVYIAATRNYAQAWAQWYASRGEEGEEPPQQPKQMMALYDKIRMTPDADEQTRLMTEILRICKEEFYAIGTVRETQKYSIIANDFHNIPKKPMQGWDYPSPGPTKPEQYFISGGGSGA